MTLKTCILLIGILFSNFTDNSFIRMALKRTRWRRNSTSHPLKKATTRCRKHLAGAVIQIYPECNILYFILGEEPLQ